MVEIVNDKELSIDENNTSKRITIPSDWTEIIGIEEENEVKAALLHSEKHGYHLGIWKKGEQPKKGEE
ncbi:MAG: hypothetical protein ABEK04_04115 [Candidatus Nanohalobium sp.]